MRKRVAAGIAGALAAILLIAAPGAAAATEFGSACVGNSAAPEYTLIQLGGEGTLAAPVSGVITKWKLNLTPEASISIPQQLKVLRATGVPSQFQVIGESAIASVVSGANAFDTRIPVQAGDRLGLYGGTEIGTLYCRTENPVDKFGAAEGIGTVGSNLTFVEEGGAQIPALAVIEADADNDGYGDETQDKCPQSAAFQTACPIVTLDAISQSGKALVVVLVATSTSAPVAVTGTVKLGKKGKPLALSAVTQTVPPGQIARFTLAFPKNLKAKLKDLSPKQALQLNIAASATNVAGQVSTDAVKAKLKGQAKPKG
jgi:hypothetical protein